LQIASSIADAFDMSLAKAQPYISSKFKNDPLKPDVVYILSKSLSSYQYKNSGYKESFIRECKGIAKELFEACVSGFVDGLYQEGPPEQDYVRSIDFCADPGFSGEDKELCASYVLKFADEFYPDKKVDQICAEINKEFTSTCRVAES
jgi:hypothetical protein